MSLEKSPSSKNKPHFNFQNLEPINYLKTFNKMLQYIDKSSQPLSSAKQLKTVHLSKFPLYSYYEQMQGVLEGSNKKQNQNQKQNKKDLQLQKLQQRFLNKHYTFVKETLEKIISNNKDQQKLLLKSKNFYQNNLTKRSDPQYENQIVKMVKKRSQSKFGSLKNTIDSARKSVQQGEIPSKLSNYYSARTYNQAFIQSHARYESEKSIDIHQKHIRKSTRANQNSKTIGTQYSSLNKDQIKVKKSKDLNETQNIEQEHNLIFKKLKPPKKRENFRNTKFEEMNVLLNARKTFFQTKYRNQLEKVQSKKDKTYYYETLTSVNQMSKKLDSQKKSISKIQILRIKNPNSQQNEITNRQLQDEFQQDRQNFEQKEELINFKKQINLNNRKNKLNDSQSNNSINTSDVHDIVQHFTKQIEKLQIKQTKVKQQFAQIVENKISKVKAELNDAIKEVIKFDYSIPKEQKSTAKKNKQNDSIIQYYKKTG